ncbi:MAG: YbaB/EbfC family nucleoid-associated protein [Defluviitaleaceae bacterium]|nr:YbaB/EbfC family nucleoid-associated protein [Defluviitaleaceae bacterium]
MRKGFNPMGGGMNMNQLMKQAKKMQDEMAAMQEEMASKTLEVSSGGGAVKVTVSGEKKILDLTISPDVVDPDDVEMLQDLVMSAVNEALRQIEESTNSQMSKLTGGLNLPGMF